MIYTKNRLIKTKPYSSKYIKLKKKLAKIEPRSMHGQLPIAWKKAKDFNVIDIHGNKFIDFTSSIFVANIGHANKNLIKNLKKTLNNDFLHSYNYIHKIREKYISKLIKFSGKNFQKAFLLSSGTEATEAALKLMRLNGLKNKKRKLGIICFEGNWHGRTMGAQLMSNNLNQKKWIGFKDKNIHFFKFPYPWIYDEKKSLKLLDLSFKKLKEKVDLKKDVCGAMLETFQGWGAVYYPKSFVQKFIRICRQNNIIVTFDEIQSGFARTGYNFGHEYYNVKPDLICCAKGMGGGFPVSGVIGKKKFMDLPNLGDMSSTNSANPLACTAGLSVLEEITKNKLVLKSKKKGKILTEKLSKIKKKLNGNIIHVSSQGLIGAIIFDKNIKNLNLKLLNVAMDCLNEGLIVVHTGRESIKIGPPLTISEDALEEGLSVLEKNIVKNLNYNG
jgi:4-aminobutyrate aminotransferase / (S)-3-amino-2-methylpropionate transaminase / 5-aminovalerate transaminase